MPRRRRDSEDAINGKSARTSDHEKSDHRECQQVKLKSLALLGPNPVREEAESMMHSQNCDQHVHTDSERRDSAQESEDEPDPTEEFGRDCQEGQWKLAGCFRVARDSPAVSPCQNDREGKLKVVLMITGQDVLGVGPDGTQELQTGDQLPQAPPLTLAHLDLGAISISYD